MAEINRIHPKEKMRQMSARQMVADLRANRPVGRIELVVLRVYPRRMVSTSRYTGPVAAACGRDESGLVGIVLWDEQVKNVQIGDIIRIESGWCREREGELVVSSGKNGRLTVIDR
ncbi:MAG: hypothetical protein O3B00_05845 [archaeon]|nr:hypothetical protein [archaeon]MDA1131007.1 hypothetical protein [archaeon]